MADAEGTTQHFPVTAGRRYSVVVLCLGFRPLPQLDDVPLGTGCVSVLLTGAPFETGTLAVTATVDGEPTGYAEQRLSVEDPPSGCELWRVGIVADGSTKRQPLPAGRYRVVLDGRPACDPDHGTVIDQRAFGRAEDEVEVRAGVETSIVMDVGHRGRLRVDLRGSGRPDDRAGELGQRP